MSITEDKAGAVGAKHSRSKLSHCCTVGDEGSTEEREETGPEVKGGGGTE